jgi:multiple sugar transport system substrate-binding protein
MIKITKNKFRIIGPALAVLVILFITGCGFKSTPPKRYPIKLTVWSLFDDSDVFGKTIEAYIKANPNVTEINYRKLSPDTYQKELLAAMASGQGPDIFLIQNTWLPSFADKIVPATADFMTEQRYRSIFPDVAAADFVNQGKVYAVPLSIDSLGLYYNKDLFNQAGITSPPSNWNDFVSIANRLTRTDMSGNIVQSGAAMGTIDNINRPTDILNLLMLQNKTIMLNDSMTQATFDQSTGTASNGNGVYPGVEALNFYTQFARSGSSYTWNPNMHYSIDAFSEGTLGMMINYSWQIATIRSKSPKLNFAVAPVPQLSPASPVNFPNYWAFAVAKNKVSTAVVSGSAAPIQIPNDTRVAEAWNFLKFLTDKPTVAAGQNPATVFDPAADYLQATGKPAARKDLIEKQKSDVDLGVFAQGNLVDKDWKEVDANAIENIFANMVRQVNSGGASSTDAIKSAATQVTNLMGGN